MGVKPQLGPGAQTLRWKAGTHPFHLIRRTAVYVTRMDGGVVMGRAGPPNGMKIASIGRTIPSAWSGKGRSHTGCVEAVVVFDPERTGGPMSVRRLAGST